MTVADNDKIWLYNDGQVKVYDDNGVEVYDQSADHLAVDKEITFGLLILLEMQEKLSMKYNK